ncbi:MAG: hypothetical protein CBC67_04075 [Gammaproteobacteria bacterium TMED107]|nr:hypothetical protein [Gammaproteobacteria bacterium]OUX75692.1 MAG: hypothetical protein CBC67_04075 [Gammaproteobacteria bacterium TMED107]
MRTLQKEALCGTDNSTASRRKAKKRQRAQNEVTIHIDIELKLKNKQGFTLTKGFQNAKAVRRFLKRLNG